MIKATKESAKFLKSTVRLPSIKWPYRPSPADLVKYLPRCTDDLYAWQRRARPADNTFVLHDGPPYANGDLHVGHALNKIIKDIICRTKLAEGKRIDFVPGWDCHGLPIEQKVLKEKGWSRDDGLDSLQIRTAARKFAYDTVKKQMKGFRSWAVMADWDRHWKTLDKDFELRQLAVFKAMAQHGLIYRKHKPVYWSPSSGTALAEAEIEYDENHISQTALIKFPLKGVASGNNETVYAVIWTTTPWTIPANQAIALNKDLEYIVARSSEHGNLLFATSRLQYVEEKIGEKLQIIQSVSTADLVDGSYDSVPAFGEGAQNRPIYHADFVKGDSGTGLVHCAPGHGKDDYEALQSLIEAGNVQVKAPVDDQGKYTEAASPANPSLLAGLNVYTEGNQKVLDLLKQEGRLVSTWKFRHSYPIDWRTKEPVMTRATAQWFADISSIKEATLKALEQVEFKPETGRARLRNTVENRNEWCISRQRAWGVPIPALYHRRTRKALLTADSIDHIISVIKERGINAWWSDPADDAAWIPDGHSADEYYRGTDTMDVWFDSGSSWTFMDGYQQKPVMADMYLEGSDQHRGWFQSSLLTNIAYQSATFPDSQKRAPFRKLVTHGFTLDGNGRKMSKSEGNVVNPEEIIAGLASRSKAVKNDPSKKPQTTHGPDALRLWAASSDWTKDVVIGDQLIETVHSNLKTYRNTFKMLLGSLKDFNAQHMVPYENLSQLDQIALLHLHRVCHAARTSFAELDFHRGLGVVNRWMITELSGFYIEAIKDTLYCDAVSSHRRQSALTALYHIFNQLQHMLGAITPLLVEETYEFSSEDVRIAGGHPLQQVWRPAPAEWDNPMYASALPLIMDVKSTFNVASERARAETGMGKSLESDVFLSVSKNNLLGSILDDTLREILVVSHFRRVTAEKAATICEPGSTSETWCFKEAFVGGENALEGCIVVKRAAGGECARCWNEVIPVPLMKEYEISESVPLCSRCTAVVSDFPRP